MLGHLTLVNILIFKEFNSHMTQMCHDCWPRVILKWSKILDSEQCCMCSRTCLHFLTSPTCLKFCIQNTFLCYISITLTGSRTTFFVKTCTRSVNVKSLDHTALKHEFELEDLSRSFDTI